ncbi:MAG: transporter substrate-binding domain-containing protein, partial [Lachnospiraceae bacterium]
MKKITALLLTVILAIGMLSACGSGKDGEKEPASAAAVTSEAAGTSAAAGTSEAAGSSAAAEGETAAADSDWAYIQEKGILVLGITLFAPMNYYEGTDTENLIGFDTELAKAVGEKLGIEVDFVEINWDSKEVELNSKNIDGIWNGMCITEERKQNMSMTDPYLYNTQAIVMKADREAEIMADVSGLTCVAEQGSTGEGKILGTIEDDDTVEVSPSEYFKDVNYIAVDSMAKALMEVKAGTADLAVIDSVAASGMLTTESDYQDLVINLD